MKRIIVLISVILTYVSVQAAIVDTIQVFSKSMLKNVPAVVIRPDNYNASIKYPVVYLLHGYSGDYRDWISKAPGFEKAADQYSIMIVCPDGGFGSWYWDSPVNKKFMYETFVSDELVKFIDSKYSTINDRTGRGITGLSMGGHGGLFLGFRHQDVYGAAGSMSGGVDIRPFPNNWDMAKQLGPLSEQPERWEKYTVINQVHLLTPNSLAIIIDCGTEDFFHKANEALHQKLLYNNIPHDYITRPGAHNWPYWKNSIKFQLLFMKNYFDANKK